MNRLLTTALALALLLTHASASFRSDTESPLFERVVVTGASLSAGYGLRQELEAKADFATIFASALRSEKSQVHAHADLGFFADPSRTAKRLLVDGLQEEPTLVVALDFLFWFAHGRIETEAGRISFLKEGLALLDSVGCPLIIADFPDMSVALDGVNPFGVEFIRTDMLPKSETRIEMNALIHQWASERKHVSVVPLATYMAEMLSEKDVKLRGNEWKGSVKTAILQEDLLHPTLEGDLGLAVLTLDTLAKTREDFCEPCVYWNSAEIRERLLERTKEEREKNRERSRKRAERKRKREEKKKREEEQESLSCDPRAVALRSSL